MSSPQTGPATPTEAAEVTVLIPVFNEEENVSPLAAAIVTVLARTGRTYEVVFVDDGSTDGTLQQIQDASAIAPQIRCVRLRRNFGQTAALQCGLDQARGRYIVTLDGDMQNDPEDIPTMLALLDEGYDLVCGWRRDRKDRYFSRKLPSRIANFLLSDLTGVRVHDFGCTLKGFRSAFVKSMPIYAEMHRYIPALAGAVGARVTEVVVRHHPRRFGKSKYGIGRTFRVLYDMLALRLLTRFAPRPLHWFGVGSLPWFLGAVAMSVIAFVDHTKGVVVHYSTIVFPTIVMLLVYLGFHFLAVGLLAELAVNVLRGPTRYVVRLDEPAGAVA